MDADPSAPDQPRGNDTGRYVEEFDDRVFTGAIADAGGSATTAEVRGRVGCSYETAYKRLRELRRAGRVRLRKVANANLWKLTETTEAPEDPI